MADVFTTLAGDLLACLCERLALTSRGQVCYCGLRHSGANAPADYCWCDCPKGRGEAWVRVAGISALAVARATGCNHGRWSLILELGSRRCVATVDADGQPPPPDVLADEAQWLLEDALAARQAVRCCPALKDKTVLNVAQTPTGPAGGCAGWLTRFVVEPLAECVCPDVPVVNPLPAALPPERASTVSVHSGG